MRPTPPRGTVSAEFRSGWDAGYRQALLDALHEKNPEKRWRRGIKPCPHPAEDGQPYFAVRPEDAIR